MKESFDIVPAETSDKVRLPRSMPYMMLRTNGASYINKKAGSILEMSHGDTLKFYHSQSGNRWYISNDPTKGASIQKSGGLFKFSDIPNIRKIFSSLGITGRKAFFPLATNVEAVETELGFINVLFIVPKFFNQE